MTTHPYRPGIPADILALSRERDLLRRRGQYARADRLKQELEDAGYLVKDNPRGAHLVILPNILIDGKEYRTARQLPSLLDENDHCTFSVLIQAHNMLEQARRCIESILRHSGDTHFEILLIDNNSADGIDSWATAQQRQEPRLHIIQASRPMGVAEAYNIGLKQSRGRYILILDTSIEITGDIFTPLSQTLSSSSVGITGLHGLRTDDLRHFETSQEEKVEAIAVQCMAFKRDLLKDSELFDERYRHPYYMDIDFSFAVRDLGTNAVTTPRLPIIMHADTQNSGLSNAELNRLNKRNFYRYLEKWGDREDLLLEE